MIGNQSEDIKHIKILNILNILNIRRNVDSERRVVGSNPIGTESTFLLIFNIVVVVVSSLTLNIFMGKLFKQNFVYLFVRRTIYSGESQFKHRGPISYHLFRL